RLATLSLMNEVLALLHRAVFPALKLAREEVHVLEAKQRKHRVGVGELNTTAREENHLLVGRNACSLVELLQLGRILQHPILVKRCVPENVHRTGDLAGAVIGRRTHIENNNLRVRSKLLDLLGCQEARTLSSFRGDILPGEGVVAERKRLASSRITAPLVPAFVIDAHIGVTKVAQSDVVVGSSNARTAIGEDFLFLV